MVKIVHYEVYTDNGEGWKLEDRFAVDQRYEALSLAKEKEKARLKVKILKENFDVQDNSYQETVEYISTPKGPTGRSAAMRTYLQPTGNSDNQEDTKSSTSSKKAPANPAGAFVKLISIILISLVSVNLLVTLLTPVIEEFVPQDIIRPILFALFFTLFLGITIPLLMTKVPWHAFTFGEGRGHRQIKDKKIYTKAENILKWYNLNDEVEPAVAPVFPEAPLEYKKHIVSFLTEVVSQVDSVSYLRDSFSKLGVKLIVYGGCFELARYGGLYLSQANSLLFEAFKILDGDKTDLEAFYEAKKTYSDNKIAVYLTGVGAYLMAQVIAEQPLNLNLLKRSFDKWEQQNTDSSFGSENYEILNTSKSDADIFMDCQVNIQVGVDFLDSEAERSDDVEEHIRGDVRNIIYNLVRKYMGMNVVEERGVTSIRYTKLNTAIRMAIESYRDIDVFQNEEQDESYRLHIKCAITETRPNGAPNLSSFVWAILGQTYDDEILTTETLKSLYDNQDNDKYEFEYLGEKEFDGLEQNVNLYKILYN